MIKLLPLFDQHITRKKEVPLSRGHHYYPSEASIKYTDTNGLVRVSGKCLRQCFYRFTVPDQKEGIDPFGMWVMMMGQAAEDVLREQIKQMGLWIDNSVRFYDEEHNISGEIDLVIRDPETDKLIILECKTAWGYNAFKELCGSKGVIGKPKDSHLLQLMIYLDLCEKKGIADQGKLIYLARDSGKKAEFDVVLIADGEDKRAKINGRIDYRFTLQDIYNRYKQLDEHLKAGTIPERDYEIEYSKEKVELLWSLGEVAKTRYEQFKRNSKKYPIGDWACNYCPFKDLCWKKK